MQTSLSLRHRHTHMQQTHLKALKEANMQMKWKNMCNSLELIVGILYISELQKQHNELKSTIFNRFLHPDRHIETFIHMSSHKKSILINSSGTSIWHAAQIQGLSRDMHAANNALLFLSTWNWTIGVWFQDLGCIWIDYLGAFQKGYTLTSKRPERQLRAFLSTFKRVPRSYQTCFVWSELAHLPELLKTMCRKRLKVYNNGKRHITEERMAFIRRQLSLLIGLVRRLSQRIWSSSLKSPSFFSM